MRKGLGILEMKKTNIEKYQYLSVLRNTNVHLFYRLLSNNVKVCSSQRVGMPRSEV
jgi:malate dehydrogenase (oxaloacetate-decarboxylating)(NADP+)